MSNNSLQNQPKKKSNFYWNSSVDEQIVKYITEKDDIQKSIIFESQLYKPITKLVESIVHRYKLYRFEHDGLEDIKQQCIVFIIETVLPKYDVSRQKSYAYIGTSVRRFLWQKIKKFNDREGRNISINDDLNDLYGDGDESRLKDNNVLNNINYSYTIDEENISDEVIKGFIEFVKEEVEMLEPIKERSTQNWVEFLNSFILVCETNHGISFIDNKIVFYNSLKKINNFSTSKNYKYMNILRDKYGVFLKDYLKLD